MKKLLCTLLAFLLCFGLCACGNDADVNTDADEEVEEEEKKSDKNKDANADDDEAAGNKDSDKNSAEKETDKDTHVETTAPVIEDCGLDVILAYAYDGDDKIVVENISDKPILEYTVAFLAFDKNGLPTDDDYSTGKKTAANIMPGEKQLVSFYGDSDDVYVSATVSKITYQGDETWERTNLQDWYNTVKSSFTVDAYNQVVSLLAADAAKAETNEFISIDSTNKVDRNSYSENDDFDFTLTNISDKDITEVKIRVLEYDENGYAVSTYPYDTYCMNDYGTGGTVNLVSGATKTYTASLFFEGTCKQYKYVVQSVTFADGEEWQNPYFYEWIFVNNKTFN